MGNAAPAADTRHLEAPETLISLAALPADPAASACSASSWSAQFTQGQVCTGTLNGSWDALSSFRNSLTMDGNALNGTLPGSWSTAWANVTAVSLRSTDLQSTLPWQWGIQACRWLLCLAACWKAAWPTSFAHVHQ